MPWQNRIRIASYAVIGVSAVYMLVFMDPNFLTGRDANHPSALADLREFLGISRFSQPSKNLEEVADAPTSGERTEE
eukprot:CAMPEP_0174237088 /NCGR_PEP_ID=MMETSP0417-20130205/6866_1 /TAXON_ID=242541 /ORGANISM="Mayorella sp, Strain BSH-02190019" /LENGTH=76 /DNA_ID=CAMNT_0015315811 /DNA_START=84 /DNA_END=314 /DNA_ORIENTATION=+